VRIADLHRFERPRRYLVDPRDRLKLGRRHRGRP
jgi:hypothetical protein